MSNNLNEATATQPSKTITIPVNHAERDRIVYDMIVTLRNSIASCLGNSQPCEPLLNAWITQCEVVEQVLEGAQTGQ